MWNGDDDIGDGEERRETTDEGAKQE